MIRGRRDSTSPPMQIVVGRRFRNKGRHTNVSCGSCPKKRNSDVASDTLRTLEGEASIAIFGSNFVDTAVCTCPCFLKKLLKIEESQNPYNPESRSRIRSLIFQNINFQIYFSNFKLQ